MGISIYVMVFSKIFYSDILYSENGFHAFSFFIKKKNQINTSKYITIQKNIVNYQFYENCIRISNRKAYS